MTKFQSAKEIFYESQIKNNFLHFRRFNDAKMLTNLCYLRPGENLTDNNCKNYRGHRANGPPSAFTDQNYIPAGIVFWYNPSRFRIIQVLISFAEEYFVGDNSAFCYIDKNSVNCHWKKKKEKLKNEEN